MATLIIQDLKVAEELDSEAMAEVQGGAIYIDGRLVDDKGTLGLSPSPGGFPAWNVWPDGSRTPH